MNKEDLKAIRDLLKEELKAELEPINSQLEENTQILKTLEHRQM